MEINLPFRKQFCPDLKKPIVTFDTEVIPVYYYPPRLHCSEALKALFEHRFSSTAASEKPSSSYNVKQEHVDSEKCGLVYVNTLCGMTNGISFVVGVHKPIWTDIINNNGYQVNLLLTSCSDPSNGFFVQTILADRYIHHREL